MRTRVVPVWIVLGVVACGDAEETAGDESRTPPGSSSGDDPVADGAGSGETTAAVDSTTRDLESSEGAGVDESGEATTTTGAAPCDPLALCTEPTEDGACRHDLVLPDGMTLAVWSNLALAPEPGDDGCRAAIDRAIVVQHGNSRNPWSYMAAVLEAASLAGVESHTLVVAPWFPAPEDDAPDGGHTWDPGGSGWKSGDDSLTDPPLSSFAAIDHLVIDRLLDPAVFPALAEIVVTGHSAGGQFVQRYAVATDVGVAMRFVVANPSSYLYLDPWRWDGDGTPPDIAFALPAGTDCDDDYDDFKYGLANVPAGHYVADHLASIPGEYLARDVVYLLGDDDMDADSSLDTSCPAMLQGEHRFERGLVFAEYLDQRFPGHAHAQAVVPEVGHDHAAMFTSTEGLDALFGR